MAAKPSTSPGISLEVTVHVAPENVQKFLSIMRPAYEAVVKEKECTFFEVVLNPAVPGQIHWVEGWTEGVEWLMDVQLKKAYYKPYLEGTEPLFVKPREHVIYERISGWASVSELHTAGKYEG